MTLATTNQQLHEAEREVRELRQSPEYIEQQNREIAEVCRQWRMAAGMTASRAAEVLGMPARTYEGIEQGRGFRYPQLLMLAMQAFR